LPGAGGVGLAGGLVDAVGDLPEVDTGAQPALR
jgi:hypothetical protein